MWILKGCFHCGGDAFIDRDEYGWFKGCLRCGYQGNLDIPTEPREQMKEKVKEPALAAQSKY
jgi:hypothetical protein